MFSLTLRWNCLLLAIAMLFNLCTTLQALPASYGVDSELPNTLNLQVMDESADLNPINAEVSYLFFYYYYYLPVF